MMLLLSLAAAATATPPIARNAPCRQPGTERAATRGSVRIRPLGEMPPARQVLAVYRSIDGCPTPVVVRDEVGANVRR